MPQPIALRHSLLIAAVAGGLMVAMIVEIELARRGLGLAGVGQALLHDGRQIQAALAWWAITGVAFLASFVIAAVTSRVSWLYLRALRWPAAAALALALATLGDRAPLSAPGAAGRQALAIFTALLAATLMAWFGAFFAVRR
jgi:hypothetical protein